MGLGARKGVSLNYAQRPGPVIVSYLAIIPALTKFPGGVLPEGLILHDLEIIYKSMIFRG